MIDNFSDWLSAFSDILFHNYVVFIVLGTGVLFTIWSGFSQYRALTHGVGVVRGKWDDKDDPGAINHFQALSAALSATVGLGNIAGVAVAVALGGPGAILWMWIIGVIGMALKTTEVTLSMLYRNTDEPDNPHGGPMWVAKEGFKKMGLAGIGTTVGGIFCVTVIISAITGGNMFQSWNVGDVTESYFGIPPIVCGIILAIVVALVIIGGIKRIGAVAGRLVPVMCVLYLLAAVYVLVLNIGEIPAMLMLIVQSGLPEWLGGSSVNPEGAFLGGTFGYAAIWGIKRALFSSEAGQGSAPIAHSAAKTNEPVREGIVAGLEPFIDTLVVCTLTALVIMLSGAWNRPPEAMFPPDAEVNIVQVGAAPDGTPVWSLESPELPDKSREARRILRITSGDDHWREKESIFMIVRAEERTDTGRDHRRITGTVQPGSDNNGWIVDWETLTSEIEPRFIELEDGTRDYGIYGLYAGAALTAHAFDRVTPGLGMWLVVLASWLFAISTMITWSYYGEQGVVYLVSWLPKHLQNNAVIIYKLTYCALIAVATMGFITTDEQLDLWTTIGLGVMLWANIPIMLIFGYQAMRAYHDYNRRLKSGEMRPPHEAPHLKDVVEGRDVE